MITFVISCYQDTGMPRGGHRKGAGRKPKWANQDTTTIRVPTVLVEQVVFLASCLDDLEKADRDTLIDSITKSKNFLDYVTKSKNRGQEVIDLKGIDIGRLHGRTLVFLSDLQRAGYKIEPKSLDDFVAKESVNV